MERLRIRPGREGVSLAAVAVLVLASAPASGAAIPVKGTYSGATAGGEPLSFLIATKTNFKRRANGERVKVTKAWVRDVMGAVPISCNSGPDRSEEVGFPGPLEVERNGRFARTGVAQSPSGRVTTKVKGRFPGRRRASGTLSYRGGFAGEFCSGRVTWKATRERA